MMELIVKDIKKIILTLSHMLESLEERLNMVSRDMEYRIKTQIKLLEMKI